MIKLKIFHQEKLFIQALLWRKNIFFTILLQVTLGVQERGRSPEGALPIKEPLWVGYRIESKVILTTREERQLRIALRRQELWEQLQWGSNAFEGKNKKLSSVERAEKKDT